MTDASQEWAINAIDEGVAAIELPNGKVIHLPVSLLPSGVREGQVLRVSIGVDTAATSRELAASAEQVKKGRNASRKIDPGGDITL